MYKAGFIGTGNMGGALVIAACNTISANDVIIMNRTPAKAQRLAEQTGCHTALSACEIAGQSQLIFLCVKPYLIKDVAEDIAPVLKKALDQGERKAVISIAAGISISSMKEYFGFDVPVMRLMPNTPAMIGQGMILAAADPDMPEAQSDSIYREVISILKGAGEFERIPEAAMNYTSSISGCTPAYTYMFIEALADGAVQMGVPREQAYRLAARTVQGSAAMVLATGEHPGRLKDQVCSPGGSTIAGVTALEENRFRYAVEQSIIQSTRRNIEMGKTK